MGGQRKKQAQRSHDRDFIHKQDVEKMLTELHGNLAPTVFPEDRPEEIVEKRSIMKKATDWLKSKIFPNS